MAQACGCEGSCGVSRRAGWQIGLGVRAGFIALALMGQATLWMAILADMGVTLLVITNGWRAAAPIYSTD
ncbi:MAG: hypothetical protein ACK4ME_00690 [Fimbriimonadales bacterium]